MMINCKKFSTALNRFFKRHPELDYWKECFEWMHETGHDFFCDDIFGDGTKNKDWSYALHLDEYEDAFYIAVIERA